MELARHWRNQDNRYLGRGSQPVTVEVDEDSLHLEDKIRGRELNYNHGQAAGWGKALVTAMSGWGYSREYVEQTVKGAAAQLNGKGEIFTEAAMAAMEEIFK